MNKPLSGKNLILFFLFAFLASFSFLSGRELFSGDETRVAGISAEIVLSGDWLVPRLHGSPFLEYPPLYYWCSAFSMKILGITDTAAKLPSACALFLALNLLLFLTLRMKISGGMALISAVMLLGINYFKTCRMCMVDSMLSFFVLLALTGCYAGTMRRRYAKAGWFLVFALGIAGGILTKGVPGLAVPCSAAFVYLLLRDIMERKCHWADWLCAGCAVLFSLVPVAIWSWMLYHKLGFDAFYTVAYINSIGRISGSQGDHVEPFYFYFRKLPTLFQPWLLLIPFGIWQAWKKIRNEKSSAALLTLCYFFIPFLLFIAASGKRQVYLLPLYPAAAVLSGTGLLFILNHLPQKKTERYLPKIAEILLCLIGLCGILFPLFRNIPAAWCCGTLTTGIALYGIMRKQIWSSLLLAFAMLFPLSEGVFGGCRNTERSLRPLFTQVKTLLQQGKKVYLICPAERTSGATVFYLHHKLPVCTDGKEHGYGILRAGQRPVVHAESFADHHYLIPNQE